jgi:hypothetical protein
MMFALKMPDAMEKSNVHMARTNIDVYHKTDRSSITEVRK